jgi:hypothetical protein
MIEHGEPFPLLRSSDGGILVPGNIAERIRQLHEEGKAIYGKPMLFTFKPTPGVTIKPVKGMTKEEKQRWIDKWCNLMDFVYKAFGVDKVTLEYADVDDPQPIIVEGE